MWHHKFIIKSPEGSMIFFPDFIMDESLEFRTSDIFKLTSLIFVLDKIQYGYTYVSL